MVTSGLRDVRRVVLLDPLRKGKFTSLRNTPDASVVAVVRTLALKCILLGKYACRAQDHSGGRFREGLAQPLQRIPVARESSPGSQSLWSG